MKVIIVGSGSAGLTFALTLEKASIDCFLLEARNNFVPIIGATIGIGPGGMRILDQLGAAQEILDQTYPLKRADHCNSDGKFIVPSTPSWDIVQAIFGYPEMFLHRKNTIRAMLNAVRRKEKMMINKSAKKIEHGEERIVVECEDGSKYEGDVVVGCDGVRSRVRRKM